MSDIEYAYPLILNKVASPHYATPTLRRARLIDWLNDAANCRAAVIAADAGYGKTTLLWQWEREVDFACYWYKLDRNDRDWTFHISYLIEAISKRHKGFGRRAHSMLQQLGGPGSSRPGVAAYLLAEMHERLTEPCTFIIDDWQYVNAVTEVRGLWNQILRDAPPTCRFVFASRSKPRLQFARFKTHSGYAELRTDALRFTESEIDELFRDIYNDPLEPAEVAELERRTEGWAASLQLVEVSLRERDSPDERRAFIRTMPNASDSDLFDFLAEEVLDQQPEDTRNFLLTTSILQQITPEVAERLAGVHDGRQELTNLEHRGLFTNRLDDVRYRYHNLFREFLERRLTSERSDAEVVGLHIHAASYFETTEQWPEAIHHYLRAGLQRQAARLIAKYGEQLVAEGRLGLVDEWLQQLPQRAIRENARLSLLYGEACGIRGDWDRAFEALERARTFFSRKGDRRLEALACLKLSSVHHYSGNVEKSADLASVGLSLVHPKDPSTRLRLEGNLAITRTWVEEGIEQAAAICKRIAVEAAGHGYEHFAAIALHNLGALQRYLGHLDDATANLGRAAAFWDRLPSNPFSDNFELVQALLALDRVPEADRVASAGMDRTEQWPRSRRDATAGKAAVLFHVGRIREALDLMESIVPTDESLGIAMGPIGQLWLDCLVLADASPSSIDAALTWIASHRRDPRNEPILLPSVAIASHFATECSGACLGGVQEVLDLWEGKGAVVPAAAGRLKVSILALLHKMPGAREHAIQALAAALHTGVARRQRWWIRKFTPFAGLLAKHRLGASVLCDLIALDPEGWRHAATLVISNLNDERRQIVLAAIVANANRETLEALRDLPGTDVGEARRVLSKKFAARLYVRSLGELEIRRGGWDGPEVLLEKRRVRSLFAFLVASSEARVSRDRLIDTLWPDADAVSGVNSLNQTVFQLRRMLDPEHDGESPQYVISTSEQVALSADLVRVDIAEARRLHRRFLAAKSASERTSLASGMIDLVRGPFMSEVLYEDWAISAATSAHAVLGEILLPIANSDVTSVATHVAVRAAHALTLLDEYDEAAQIALARQLAASGRKTAARDAILRFASRLRQELDEEPAGELAEALQAFGVHQKLTQAERPPI